jgi:hypothetical protein
MSEQKNYPLTTKRQVIAHVAMCVGCCCGNVSRGKPEVPVDWLKQEWKRRGLLRNVQLTISGCVGPCDLANVVTIGSSSGYIWLGNVRDFKQYSDLVEWASQCKDEGQFLPLPNDLQQLRFEPFRPTLSAERSSCG